MSDKNKKEPPKKPEMEPITLIRESLEITKLIKNNKNNKN